MEHGSTRMTRIFADFCLNLVSKFRDWIRKGFFGYNDTTNFKKSNKFPEIQSEVSGPNSDNDFSACLIPGLVKDMVPFGGEVDMHALNLRAAFCCFFIGYNLKLIFCNLHADLIMRVHLGDCPCKSTMAFNPHFPNIAQSCSTF